MRKIKKQVYIESKFTGVHLGVVRTHEGLMLIDCPLKSEEGKEWFAQLSEYGVPRYLVLLDAHPDRVLGARAMELPLIAQDRTLETIREWADTFKGSLHPIGAESDRVKRITGVQRSAPEITFSKQMRIHLGEVIFEFLHRPGPQAGSSWILLPEEKVAFIGDTVAVDEPPYFGNANLERWLESLDELRSYPLEEYTLISSQGGPLNREEINAMARFLRKVEHRLQRVLNEKLNEQEIGLLAEELLEDFQVQGGRRDQMLLRLQAGLVDLASAES
jgi:glyoxylase-like metal-dependent hydrolase (beta-lactamase superfamily II)